MADSPKSTTQPSVKDYADKLLASRNIILHGAPGTGKTYLAKQIAAHLITNGTTDDYADLTPEQQEQCGFVQFHPSYDYTDFVEGLRPIKTFENSIGFELHDGLFTKFCKNAQKNLLDNNSTPDNSSYIIMEDIDQYVEECLDKWVNYSFLKTKTGNAFTIKEVEGLNVILTAPKNPKSNRIVIKKDQIKKAARHYNTKDFGISFLEKDLGFGHNQQNSYIVPIVDAVYKTLNPKNIDKIQKLKYNKYIFIIDEINRGEISKIFGELFYSIDPGYRGPAGAVSTQYSNLHKDPSEKFYIPENVYIIGTMNDIDRSVDTFDFAMRRRFRFINVDANEHISMLDALDTLGSKVKEQAIARMRSLNSAIDTIDGLNQNYHVGAAYFLKLKDINNNFNILWSDYLAPLLQDYVHGLYSEQESMSRLEQAYNLQD